MNRYSDTVKQEAIDLHKSGIPAAKVAESHSISRSTVYKWLKEQDNVSPDLTKSSLNGKAT